VPQSDHGGSAGKMEAAAVIEMSERFGTACYGKYINYVVDGDNKTLGRIVNPESCQYTIDENKR
jgi:hypothetical protein